MHWALANVDGAPPGFVVPETHCDHDKPKFGHMAGTWKQSNSNSDGRGHKHTPIQQSHHPQ